MKTNKVIFLDRDGTINEDKGYISSPKDFHFLPNAIEALKLMKENGFLLIIITNQSGIGRDYYTEEDYHKVTDKMGTILKENNLIIDDCFYCPHSPESNCDCRKPGTVMIDKAIEKWNVDISKSFFIGDKLTDIQAGNTCNLETILISNTVKDFQQNYTAKDLMESYKYIIKHSNISEENNNLLHL